jgi:hypothetical protein
VRYFGVCVFLGVLLGAGVAFAGCESSLKLGSPDLESLFVKLAQKSASRNTEDVRISQNLGLGALVEIQGVNGIRAYSGSPADSQTLKYFFPVLGHIVGQLENQEVLVALNLDKQDPKLRKNFPNLSTDLFVVPFTAIRAVGSSDRDAFQEKMALTEKIQFNFQPGQKVRLRLYNGQMVVGIFLEESGDSIRVRAPEGPGKRERNLKIPREEVFPLYESLESLSSPDHSAMAELKWDDSRGTPLRAVLNAAARVISHPDFVKAPPLERLKLLARFTNFFLPWTECAAYPERTFLLDFNDALRAGVGVCRHNAPLLARFLAEAGLDPKLVASDDPQEVADHTHTVSDPSEPGKTRQIVVLLSVTGHVWVEIMLNDQKYFVDPNHEPYVFTEAEVKAQAGNPSFRFYLSQPITR